MRKNKEFLQDRLIYAFIVIALFIITFFSSVEKGEYVIHTAISVPYIVSPISNIILLYVSIFGTLIGIFFLDKRIKFNFIHVFFAVRLIAALFSSLIHQNFDFFGNYTLIIAEVTILTITMQMKNFKDQTIINTYNMFIIIMSIQVISSFWLIRDSYFLTSYKAMLAIPVGLSNFISCFILPGLIATINMKEKNKFTYTGIIIMFLGLVLTKSRGALLILIGYAIVKCLNIVNQYIKKNNIKKIFRTIMIAISLTIPLSFFIAQYSDKILTVLIGFSSSVTEGSIFNKLTSGRMELYSERLGVFFENILFGQGLEYGEAIMRSHNFLIDSAYELGIFGLISVISIVFIWYRKIKPYKMDKLINYCYIFGVVMIIQSFFEINIFANIYSDIFFFSLMGLSLAKVRRLKANDK